MPGLDCPSASAETPNPTTVSARTSRLRLPVFSVSLLGRLNRLAVAEEKPGHAKSQSSVSGTFDSCVAKLDAPLALLLSFTSKTYVHIHICVYIYIHTCICICVYIYICIYICIFLYKTGLLSLPPLLLPLRKHICKALKSLTALVLKFASAQRPQIQVQS